MLEGNGQPRRRHGEELGRLGSLLMWTVKNTAIILGVILVVTVFYGIGVERVEGRPQGAFGRVMFGAVLIAVGLIPGGLLYLVAVWLIPDRWERFRQRYWALLLSPIVALLVWISLFEDQESVLATLGYGLAMSIPSGFLVRLRHSRS